jgi:hypothetical protein
MTIFSALKRFSIATTGAALLILEIGGGAQAAILGTTNLSANVLGNDISTGILTDLRIGPNIIPPVQSGLGLRGTLAPLFEDITITPADVGQRFTVTEATDPDFNDFVALLTDGLGNMISLYLYTNLGQGGSSLGFGSGVIGGNPDFLGNTISSISLQINSLILNTPVPPDQNGQRPSTYYSSFNGTLIIEGQPVDRPSQTVPEPTAGLSLLLFGAVGTGSLLKRQIKSNGLSKFLKQQVPN